MEELLKNLNQNYSNIITAGATVIYMIFTGWLILETRKTRKMQEKPYIEVFLRREKSRGNMLELVIKNIGYSGAHSIKLSSDKDFNLLDNNDRYTLKNLGFFKNGISFLPVNGEIVNTFTILSTNYEEKIKWKINILCEYTDKYGDLIKDSFLLDLSSFEDTFLPQDEPIYKIEKHLKSIEKSLNKISTGFLNASLITQNKKDYIAEQKEKFEEYKKAKENL
ncbi:hypothetical protein HGA92_02495 [Candidatus Gracilibacteria bacterium]|nr:hypothetical protein [Candidatus Gracilibacteria bacterium]NUJ99356.1 hypothetical protein [Candidatus Gracilibacteria bacterium]